MTQQMTRDELESIVAIYRRIAPDIMTNELCEYLIGYIECKEQEMRKPQDYRTTPDDTA